MISRPLPPDHLLSVELLDRVCEPARDLMRWLRAVFIDEEGPLANEDHAHLRSAEIAALWCVVPIKKNMLTVVGQAEIPAARGNAWAKARHDQQLTEWFGRIPDFLLTFDPAFAASVDDAVFCALVEHELYHCGQNRDEFGAPKFRSDGNPSFGIRGHDVEEFVGVVQRYGVRAGAGRTIDFVAAANSPATVSEVAIQGACGTCGRAPA